MLPIVKDTRGSVVPYNLIALFALELDCRLGEHDLSCSSESSLLRFKIPFNAPARRPLAIATSPIKIYRSTVTKFKKSDEYKMH